MKTNNAVHTPYTVSPNGYTDDFGPNVANILAQGERVIRGRIPASVRKELASAVKAGALGRLPKSGLKPEVFFHPSHKNGALERQKREAEYAVGCIASVVVSPKEFRDGISAMGQDVETTLLNRARTGGAA